VFDKGLAEKEERKNRKMLKIVTKMAQTVKGKCQKKNIE